MKRRVAFGIIAVITVFGSACSDDSGTTGPSTASRLEGNWSLAAFELAAGGVETVSDPQSYTIQFTAEGRLGMRADCNRCASAYEAHGLDLSIGDPMACTRAFCGTESKSAAFIRAVAGASSYQRNGQSLFLYYEGGRLRLQGD